MVWEGRGSARVRKFTPGHCGTAFLINFEVIAV